MPPNACHEGIALSAKPTWKPDLRLSGKCRVNISNYNFDTFGDIFTSRQLVSWGTFIELLEAIRAQIEKDIEANPRLRSEIEESKRDSIRTEYPVVIISYLACAINRMIYYGSSLGGWLPKDSAIRDCMPRQALAMAWEFTEANPFGKSSGDFATCLKVITNFLSAAAPNAPGYAAHAPAQEIALRDESGFIVSCDPPYYDNIDYADLSDFFYCWLRRSVGPHMSPLFSTIGSPKNEEIISSVYGTSDQEGFIQRI